MPPPAGTPDVFLISLDTTRADHLSTYGYERDTSLAASDGVAPTRSSSRRRARPRGGRCPGHASMLTGMYPSRHGAHFAGGWLRGPVDRRPAERRLSRSPPSATTLAEVLRDRGYATGGFVANFSYLYRDFGMAQGFQRYEDAPGLLLRVRPPVVALRAAVRAGLLPEAVPHARTTSTRRRSAWLDAAPAGRPAFVFLNYMEPHQPGWRRRRTTAGCGSCRTRARSAHEGSLHARGASTSRREERDFITANYDGQVAAMDAALGELVAALKARGRYENALIIVTADHGELLGEHDTSGTWAACCTSRSCTCRWS